MASFNVVNNTADKDDLALNKSNGSVNTHGDDLALPHLAHQMAALRDLINASKASPVNAAPSAPAPAPAAWTAALQAKQDEAMFKQRITHFVTTATRRDVADLVRQNLAASDDKARLEAECDRLTRRNAALTAAQEAMFAHAMASAQTSTRLAKENAELRARLRAAEATAATAAAATATAPVPDPDAMERRAKAAFAVFLSEESAESDDDRSTTTAATTVSSSTSRKRSAASVFTSDDGEASTASGGSLDFSYGDADVHDLGDVCDSPPRPSQRRRFA